MAVWNYLRVRGEYTTTDRKGGRSMELPPRARRIPGITPKHNPSTGTTSACAENTRLGLPTPSHIGNYLRVRGEYGTGDQEQLANEELPPRAR